MSRWTSADDNSERVCRELARTQMARPGWADNQTQADARDWFYSEWTRCNRGILGSLSSNASERDSKPQSWTIASGWASKMRDLMLFASLAETGAISWTEAQARFEEADRNAVPVAEEAAAALSRSGSHEPLRGAA